MLSFPDRFSICILSLEGAAVIELSLIVAPEDDQRTAGWLLRKRLGCSTRLLTRMRYDGRITADGLPVRTIDPLPAGTLLRARYDAPDEAPSGLSLMADPDCGVDVLWQDDWLLLANKPAGLLTHPNYVGETRSLITSWGPYVLHPVSRLDRDTSGVVLLTRNGYAHAQLNEAKIKKVYLGLVQGTFAERSGVIDAPIRRADDSIIRREIHQDGQIARTRFEVLDNRTGPDNEPLQLVAFRLETGRTHQIRLHCLHAGHPLVGETLYTDREMTPLDELIGRQALHAAWLSFIHPITQEELSAYAPLPADILRLGEASTTSTSKR